MPRTKGEHPFHMRRASSTEEITIEIPRDVSLAKMLVIAKTKFLKKLNESSIGPLTKNSSTRLIETTFYPKTIKLTYSREETPTNFLVEGKKKKNKVNEETYNVKLPGGKEFI